MASARSWSAETELAMCPAMLAMTTAAPPGAMTRANMSSTSATPSRSTRRTDVRRRLRRGQPGGVRDPRDPTQPGGHIGKGAHRAWSATSTTWA